MASSKKKVVTGYVRPGTRMHGAGKSGPLGTTVEARVDGPAEEEEAREARDVHDAEVGGAISPAQMPPLAPPVGALPGGIGGAPPAVTIWPFALKIGAAGVPSGIVGCARASGGGGGAGGAAKYDEKRSSSRVADMRTTRRSRRRSRRVSRRTIRRKSDSTERSCTSSTMTWVVPVQWGGRSVVGRRSVVVAGV